MANVAITEMTAADALTGIELLEVSQPSTSIDITAATISAVASGNHILDSGNGFISAGFQVGDRIKVSGFTGDTSNNHNIATILTLSAGDMTVDQTMVNDSAGESVTIAKWVTKRTTAVDIQAVGRIPQNSQSGNYTTVLADAGKHIYHPSGSGSGDTFTIDSNANVPYVIGTAITFVNRENQNLSIAITSDTMYLAGLGSTGTRTLAENGIATALKLSATTWIISGVGLT